MDKQTECKILHNQLMLTEKELIKIQKERDFWKREAISDKAKLGEIRL